MAYQNTLSATLKALWMRYSTVLCLLVAAVASFAPCQSIAILPFSHHVQRQHLSSIFLQPNDRVVNTDEFQNDDVDEFAYEQGSNAAYEPLYDAESSSILTLTQQRELKRKRMELFMCNREFCSDGIRERVSGDENHMEFDGPATGQVCYVWDNSQDAMDTKRQSVLLLVRPGDDALLHLAGDAVQALVKEGIQIYLAPELAAKLKHYHGVEDRQNLIKLYEPLPVPGFGGE